MGGMSDGDGRLSTSCRDLHLRIDDLLAALPASPADVAPLLQDMLGQPPDLVVRRVGEHRLAFLQSTVDGRRVEEAVVPPLALGGGGTFTAHTSPVHTYGDALQAILQAQVVVAGPEGVAALSMDQWPKREPTEPPAEIVPQGPHVGFIEHLQSNVALLRMRIRDPRLRWRRLEVGLRAPLPVAVLYFEGLAEPGLVERVEARVRETDASFLTDTSMLAEWLTSRSGWLFPTMQATERPDIAAAALLEGRVVVIAEGSPVAVIAPQVFAHLLHTPTDYYNRSLDAAMRRTVRLTALIVALVASPGFVALVTTNQELIPTKLFVSIAQARLGVPLPAVAEVLVMEVMVELLREASLRMPGAVGQSLSVVGAVVIGQSAVMAGLISAPVVVVVSMSFIAAVAVPSLDGRVALRLLRFPLTIVAAIFGLFGLVWGLMVVLLYLLSLESFGVPYLVPVAPRRPRGLQDTLRRVPLTDMRAGFTVRRGARSA